MFWFRSAHDSARTRNSPSQPTSTVRLFAPYSDGATGAFLYLRKSASGFRPSCPTSIPLSPSCTINPPIYFSFMISLCAFPLHVDPGSLIVCSLTHKLGPAFRYTLRPLLESLPLQVWPASLNTSPGAPSFHDRAMSLPNPSRAQRLGNTSNMNISVAILWCSIFLLLVPDDLLDAISGSTFKIGTPLCLASILLQFANILLSRLSDVLLFDYEWLFLVFSNLNYRKRSIPRVSRPATTRRDTVYNPIVSPLPPKSLLPSILSLAMPMMGPKFEDMLASRILTQTAFPVTIQPKQDSTTEPEASEALPSPYQRRSLFPCMSYSCGTTTGSPRAEWIAAKKSCRRHTIEEVDRLYQSAEESTDTIFGVELPRTSSC